MYSVYEISKDLIYLGANDRRLALFESVYPIPKGVSYNSYLLKGEKTALIDTVDRAVAGQFMKNLHYALAGRRLDYIIINHMEPDHAATLQEVAARYPEAKIVINIKTLQMIKQFFEFDIETRAHIVNEGDAIDLGGHVLTFVMAPMVHWPEVMVTYDLTEGTLFSADAFGTFGALSGNIFADETDFDMAEARRYYTNIVGKYGTQVQALLKKAAGLDIKLVCPLHGPVWRRDIGSFISKYVKWATYTPEDEAVVIAYASVYGNTENAANMLATMLARRGVCNIALYDVSVTHASHIIAECFRASHLVFASTTYNSGIFVNMENLINDIVAHNLQNRTVAVIDNGSWAATAGSKIVAALSKLKNMTFLEERVSIRSSVKDAQREQLEKMADSIVASMPSRRPAEAAASAPVVDQNAMFALSYGLYVLTAREDGRDNGCIINTVTQVTDTPKRVSVVVNKQNLTHDMIKRTGKFNISVISTAADMGLFRRFGFASGRDTDKFAGGEVLRTENSLAYVAEGVNAVISVDVTDAVDVGTHSIFIGEVREARMLSGEPSATYDYYHKHIKPQPQPALEDKKGWVCKICGYVYEGDELPEDYVCPLCKHGPDDFERIG